MGQPFSIVLTRHGLHMGSYEEECSFAATR